MWDGHIPTHFEEIVKMAEKSVLDPGSVVQKELEHGHQVIVRIPGSYYGSYLVQGVGHCLSHAYLNIFEISNFNHPVHSPTW